MASTYIPIATTTLGSSATDYTFSSIPSTYTDLVVVITGSITANNNTYRIQFNGDTAGNYSYSSLGGTSGGPNSVRSSNTSFIPFFVLNGAPNTSVSACIVSINNYANVTTYKNALIRANYGDGEISAIVGSWRSTSAINSVKVLTSAGNLASGTSLTIYGIAAA